MIDFDDDINEMLSEDDHGVEILFKGSHFSGISNREFLNAEAGVDDDEQDDRVVYVPTRKVKRIKYGDALVVDKERLYVLGVQSDSTGMTALILSDENPTQ